MPEDRNIEVRLSADRSGFEQGISEAQDAVAELRGRRRYPRRAGSTWENDIQHRDGMPWWEAPLPPRLHKCSAQTHGWARLDYVERCACGAIKLAPSPYWMDRNSRRRDQSPEVPTRRWWRFWR